MLVLQIILTATAALFVILLLSGSIAILAESRSKSEFKEHFKQLAMIEFVVLTWPLTGIPVIAIALHKWWSRLPE